MASTGYGVKLPLIIEPESGPYALHNDLRKTISQNLKMLILTSPGERIMNIHYGVGLRRFLFEPNNPHTIETIRDRIRTQVKAFMPYVKIQDINFSNLENSKNAIKLSIFYTTCAANQQNLVAIVLKSILKQTFLVLIFSSL